MANQEDEIERLEAQFPTLSGQAFATARQQALDAGHSVLQSEEGFIFEVFPNGNRVMVKKIEPPISVTTGQVFTIR